MLQGIMQQSAVESAETNIFMVATSAGTGDTLESSEDDVDQYKEVINADFPFESFDSLQGMQQSAIATSVYTRGTFESSEDGCQFKGVMHDDDDPLESFDSLQGIQQSAAVTLTTCTAEKKTFISAGASPNNSVAVSNLHAQAQAQAGLSNTKRTIFLSDEKIAQLVGRKEENLKFIEKICDVKITVVTSRSRGAVDVGQPKQNSEVILMSTTGRRRKTFDDLEWAGNVFRFVKSATRGGFVKKLAMADYNLLANKNSGCILNENNIKTLEGRYNVEIKYFGFNELVYVCVLEKLGAKSVSQGLELSIALVAEWIHGRYRSEHSSVPLSFDFKFRRCIPDDNRITRREQKRRDFKRK